MTNRNVSKKKEVGGSVLDVLSMPTPGMAQFAEIKAVNPGFLLFYRMGDFFELFFDDAVIASETLGIVLTKRGKYNGKDIPMCGVPVKRAEEYLHRLVVEGFKVAVCEQLETPEEARKRGAKSIVKRDVVRLVTPGTLTEDNLLDTRRNHYLAALYRNKDKKNVEFCLSWIDVSTGDFYTECIDYQQLLTEMSRLQPSELIIADSLAIEDPDLIKVIMIQVKSLTISEVEISRFDSDNAVRRLKKYFAVESLAGFGQFDKDEYASMGALLSYIEYTQAGKMPILHPPLQIHSHTILHIDGATRHSLELTHTVDGQRKGSLLHTIDRTLTSMGGRMLMQWVSTPLTAKVAIDKRLQDVSFWFENQDLYRQLREHLRHCPDVARAMGRLGLYRGTPRDLLCIAQFMTSINAIVALVNDNSSPDNKDSNRTCLLGALPDNLAMVIKKMSLPQEHELQKLGQELDQALVKDTSFYNKDGGFINPEYDNALKEMIELRDGSRHVISRLEQSYCEQTKIKGLKIKHNNILGYFIEVREQYGKQLTSSDFSGVFIHRQTLANDMRFSTVELAELETRINHTHHNIVTRERDIFNDFVEKVCSFSDLLGSIVQCIAYIDVVSSLAKLAKEQDYCCPIITEGEDFEIQEGRHPVVEQMLAKGSEEDFIANDCVMTTKNIKKRCNVWILTGPNMAGKSTFLRQNALFIILAQMGSFVPAKKAVIGVADKLFSRVGASDNISRGESTFMVEMVETAAIINRATAKSFVILDEIGRGTATFDGMAIAWSVVEHIHNKIKARSIIATHFHELTALEERLDNIYLASMRVMEWQGQLKFLHQVITGSADRSYGIQVAKIAGIPQIVISRAEQVLQSLETQRSYKDVTGIQQLPLFASNVDRQSQTQSDISEHESIQASCSADDLLSRSALAARDIEIIEKIKQINPDSLTPLEALTLIHECVEKLK